MDKMPKNRKDLESLLAEYIKDQRRRQKLKKQTQEKDPRKARALYERDLAAWGLFVSILHIVFLQRKCLAEPV